VKDVTARVVIEECLASVPAVRDILNDPQMHFLLSVRPREHLMADDADIVLAAVGDDDDASVEELLSARPSPSRPRVMLVTSETSKVFHEEAIIRGAFGILHESASEVFVLKALACVARGELWLDRQTTGRVFDRLSRGMIGKKFRLSVVAVC
jgi:DNA-binding NarL/FixJ family response regulator